MDFRFTKFDSVFACPNCAYFGAFNPKVFVSVYEVNRIYGGPEEGGWWYDTYRLITSSKKMKKCRALTVQAELQEKWSQENEGDINSVLGGANYHVYIEPVVGYHHDVKKQYYC